MRRRWRVKCQKVREAVPVFRVGGLNPETVCKLDKEDKLELKGEDWLSPISPLVRHTDMSLKQSELTLIKNSSDIWTFMLLL